MDDEIKNMEELKAAYKTAVENYKSVIKQAPSVMKEALKRGLADKIKEINDNVAEMDTYSTIQEMQAARHFSEKKAETRQWTEKNVDRRGKFTKNIVGCVGKFADGTVLVGSKAEMAAAKIGSIGAKIAGIFGKTESGKKISEKAANFGANVADVFSSVGNSAKKNIEKSIDMADGVQKRVSNAKETVGAYARATAEGAKEAGRSTANAAKEAGKTTIKGVKKFGKVVGKTAATVGVVTVGATVLTGKAALKGVKAAAKGTKKVVQSAKETTSEYIQDTKEGLEGYSDLTKDATDMIDKFGNKTKKSRSDLGENTVASKVVKSVDDMSLNARKAIAKGVIKLTGFVGKGAVLTAQRGTAKNMLDRVTSAGVKSVEKESRIGNILAGAFKFGQVTKANVQKNATKVTQKAQTKVYEVVQNTQQYGTSAADKVIDGTHKAIKGAKVVGIDIASRTYRGVAAMEALGSVALDAAANVANGIGEKVTAGVHSVGNKFADGKAIVKSNKETLLLRGAQWFYGKLNAASTKVNEYVEKQSERATNAQEVVAARNQRNATRQQNGDKAKQENSGEER